MYAKFMRRFLKTFFLEDLHIFQRLDVFKWFSLLSLFAFLKKLIIYFLYVFNQLCKRRFIFFTSIFCGSEPEFEQS